MDFGALIPLALVALMGAGMGLAAYLSPAGRAKRAMRAARLRRISDVADGEVVKLRGRLRYLKPPVRAPITSRPCAAWHVVVVDANRRNDALVDEREWVEFLLEDDTGRAVVDAVSPKFLIVLDAHLRSGLWEEPLGRARSFLEARGESTKGLFFNRELRYREGVLEEGEEVSVLGVGRWEPDPEPGSAGARGYRGQALRLRVREAPDGRLLITDDPSLLD